MAPKAWQFRSRVQSEVHPSWWGETPSSRRKLQFVFRFNPELAWDYAGLTVSQERASLSFMALLRGLFWLVLFIVLAFSFVILFEYGPREFVNGSQKEFARVKSFVVKQTEKIQKPKK
jgi:hypothetical protein